MTAAGQDGERLVLAPTATISRDDLIGFQGAVRIEAARLQDDVDYLLYLLVDVASKATPYGGQDGGFVAMYLLPTGPIHRILSTLGQYGRSVPLPPGLLGSELLNTVGRPRLRSDEHDAATECPIFPVAGGRP